MIPRFRGIDHSGPMPVGVLLRGCGLPGPPSIGDESVAVSPARDDHGAQDRLHHRGVANVQTTFAFVYQFEVAGSFPIGGDIVIYEPMVVLSIVLARRSGCILGRSDARRLHTLGLGLLLQCVGVAAYIPLFDERVPLWLLLIPRVIIGWSNSMTGPLASLTSYSLPHAPRPREPHTKPG